jgi:hypothetical protein
MFLINYTLKFKYQLHGVKVNITHGILDQWVIIVAMRTLLC